MSLSLPRCSAMAQGRVIKRARNNVGNVIGRANENPSLDTREYVMEFGDECEADISANTIVQSMSI